MVGLLISMIASRIHSLASFYIHKFSNLELNACGIYSSINLFSWSTIPLGFTQLSTYIYKIQLEESATLEVILFF